jgi:putative hydrolase of the HAD superfamily
MPNFNFAELIGIIKMEKIESVIFDWGGVLIDDPRPGLLRYCCKAFGVSLQDYAPVHDSFLDDFHKGEISEERFWRQIAVKLGKSMPSPRPQWYEAFRSAYIPRHQMFSLVSSLHDKGYKTALLSNTEIPAVRFFLEKNYNMFDLFVFSCIERVMKPERRIYEITLERLDSKAGQAVFIDDRQDYIQGAKSIGLNTILFQSVEQAENGLIGLGVA